MKNDRKSPEFVVGIGASAGGLEAIEGLLPGLPAGKNAAYIFLQHSASHESGLREVLENFSPLPITMAADGMILERDTLYLCPPATECEISDGRFLIKTAHQHGPRHTIDILFSSLARQFPEHCIGVILSGTGSDGIMGLQEIKTAGGWTVIQEPATAEYASMPQNALSLYLGDFVRPPPKIGGELEEIIKLGEPKPVPGSIGDQEKLQMLLEILANKSGFNFRRYKEMMLLRRIRRRMVANKVNTLGEYILLVQKSPNEALLLIKDMFITVTGFFRDERVFKRLNDLLRQLLEKKNAGNTLRVWSAGCATGEEAYSIALLLAELQKELTDPPDVRIFATDIDPDNIYFARKGTYPAKAVENIPADLLQRYFDRVENGYQIAGELRDMVVFAVHDVTHDTAFSKIDLICCRNLLIYFNRPTQARLLSRFHYSLNKEGYLLLGSSESTIGTEKLFKPVDRQHALYQSREVKNRPAITPADYPLRAVPPEHAAGFVPWQQQAWELYFNEYAPAAVLLNNRLELMHVHGRVNDYLSLPEGNFNVNILHMAGRELKTDMQMVLQQAQRSGTSIRSRSIKLESGGKKAGQVLVTMVAIPQKTTTESGKSQGDILLVFEENPVPEEARISGGKEDGIGKDEHIKALEEELAVTREQLQANIEALEAANQELQSVNEEFHSTMEELQSSNEEFQTSNEELESTNEELVSVNDELKTKSQELGRVNEELDTILNVVLAGIIVLDADLQVTRYSDSCRQLFKLWPEEAGNIQQLMLRLDGLTAISPQIQKAIKTGQTCQLDAELDDRFFMIRLIPILEPGSDTVLSLLIAFYDETERERHGRESELLAAIVKTSDDAIIVQDLGGGIRIWNDGARRMFRYRKKQALNLKVRDLIARGHKKHYEDYVDNLVKGGKVHGLEIKGLTESGNTIDIWSSASVLRNRNGQVDGIAVIFRDIGEKKAMEDKLNAVVESTPDPFIIVTDDGTIQRVNRQAEKLFGYTRREMVGQPFKMMVPERFRKQHDDYHEYFLQKPAMRRMGSDMELRCLLKSGEEVPVEIGLSPVRDGEETTVMVRFRDIRTEKEEQLLLSQAKLKADEANRTKTRFLAAASHDLRQPLHSISMYLGTLTGPISASEKKRIIDQAQMAVDTTNKLLNALLNISKLESGKVQAEIETFSIDLLLKRVYNTEAPQAQERQQDFVMVRSSACVTTDPALLEQLVTNLVANAIKYSPPHSHIVLGCRLGKSHLKIQVADNGPGIKSTELDSIFDEYRQLEYDGNYLGKGLGLGLSIVKLIAELLDLELEVASMPGKGSIFSVLVPLAKAKPREKSSRQRRGKGKAFHTGRVLLIEDDPSVLDSTTLFLEMSGYSLITARDSGQAMDALKKHRPDVIITDYGLAQEENGIELVKRIRKVLKTKVPAVVVTGDTAELRSREAKTAGCDIIAKPIEAQALIQALEDLLAKK